ncbi:MAG: bifunctional D-glycero-beta-D-manno-heptose-7-phosphate kinase/D-glycero-beta-D-manno-heptose 1-phosphate adenylyltransferase HldE [Candidatus Margulisbacteria bacterium]|nr:bifunctional D-glycero-beta-D-manno-heptose-7-phosphate kinase/D-glycero-beta-D-manno-heptose 1-phosphate adenylyltransferase HldE [Candidatus Margulisiibacteriota bacterium]
MAKKIKQPINISELSRHKIAVFGDVMLDKYFRGSVSRISPEAPVPVVKVNKETSTLGGAGNVAHNIATLNMAAVLLGFTGKDQHARDLSALAKKANVNLQTVTTDNPTVTKIRVLGEHQQITRLDFEEPLNITKNLIEQTKKQLGMSGQIQAIIISDYNKGACSPALCKMIIGYAKAKNIPVLIDPKGQDWDKYDGAFLVTPNVKEVEQILKTPVSNEDKSIEKAGKEILKKYNFEYLLITRSEKGMSLISKKSVRHFPTEAKEVYDVSGAGDTVIATLAWGIVQGKDILDATYLANLAAGIVVSKLGTTPIYIEELMIALNPTMSKILDMKTLDITLKKLKNNNKKIVFTNGCFDIIHRGHLEYLKKAKSLGDILIIGVNSDSSVRKLKGKTRPINKSEDRMNLLSHLDFVDYIVEFSEDTPYELLKTVKPDILVKGGDYKPSEVIGRQFARELKILPFVQGYSTTNIIKKISNKKGD